MGRYPIPTAKRTSPAAPVNGQETRPRARRSHGAILSANADRQTLRALGPDWHFLFCELFPLRRLTSVLRARAFALAYLAESIADSGCLVQKPRGY